MADDKLDATIVVAVSRNNVIGKNNQLPWKLRSDLQRFKRLTMGQALIMGRKTYESIGKPLPGRQTVVLSRTLVEQESSVDSSSLPNPVYATSLSDGLRRLPTGMHAFIVGGGEIFRETIGLVNRIFLTRVLADIEGDAYFPEWDEAQWRMVTKEYVPAGEHDQWPTIFEEWVR